MPLAANPRRARLQATPLRRRGRLLVHLCSFYLRQPLTIFMPTTHRTLRAFVACASVTLLLRMEQSSTCCAASFCQSRGRARPNGRPSRQSRRPVTNSGLESRLRPFASSHRSFGKIRMTCRPLCRVNWTPFAKHDTSLRVVSRIPSC